MKKIIDLRSDTMTHPTQEMKKAMVNADLGNDVLSEDPTVNKLQDLAAKMFRKEAALFVVSGTMGNLIALLTHCNRGDEVILGDKSHIFLNEGGGMAVLGGIHPFPIKNYADGTLKIEDIRRAIRPGNNPHHPHTKLIALENTHNACGGYAISSHYIDTVCELAHRNNLLVHLDGARIFNAAIKLKTPVYEIIKNVDSVQFCLSKGLCAPVGSLLCGTQDFINRAIRIRKVLGGGLRQAGVLAAAGIVSLEKMVDRLIEDHENAEILGTGLSNISGIKLDFGSPQTNIIYVKLSKNLKITAYELASRLESSNIKIEALDNSRIRMVTHFWISNHDIQTVVRAFELAINTEP